MISRSPEAFQPPGLLAVGEPERGKTAGASQAYQPFSFFLPSYGCGPTIVKEGHRRFPEFPAILGIHGQQVGIRADLHEHQQLIVEDYRRRGRPLIEEGFGHGQRFAPEFLAGIIVTQEAKRTEIGKDGLAVGDWCRRSERILFMDRLGFLDREALFPVCFALSDVRVFAPEADHVLGSQAAGTAIRFGDLFGA
jgi:hypothetical protein